MNFGDLKSAIGTHYNHATVTSNAAMFVTLAESDLRRDVRVQAMESKATGTMVAGVITLPSNFIEARNLVIDGYSIEYKTAEQFQEMETVGWATSGSAGRYFTRVGNTLEVLNGVSDSYSLQYYGAFSALSADADTNWLLTYAPDVYLFKALVYAAIFMKDSAAGQGYESIYQAAKDKTNYADYLNKYSGSGLSIQASTYA